MNIFTYNTVYGETDMKDEPIKTASADALDIAVIDLAQAIPVARGEQFKIGMMMEELYTIENAAIGISDGKIVFVGSNRELLENCRLTRGTRIVNGTGRIALPGFVDPHTHLIFSGTREHELDLKLRGITYLEILGRGGGIQYTVRKTRESSLAELMFDGRKRLDRMLLHGTTTAEAKSGYGLDRDTELRSLLAIRGLDATHPIDLVPTFLGAHAVPPEFKGRTGEYIDHIIREVLPGVAERKLARYCDVFLEKGVFGVEDARRLLERAAELGLGLKLHVDEIENLGGADLACELGARSTEHLVRTTKAQMTELARKGICCIFLPGTPFSLMDDDYPRAREFIEAGCIVALATDLNPNCMTENLQNIISLACYKMGMTPAEAISAVTLNAAYGIGMSERIGSIEVGKKADVIILDIDDYRKLPYHFGVNHVEHVIKNGKIEVFEGRPTGAERYVYIYAFRGGRLMMVKSVSRGGWEIPGGRVQAGEDPSDAAVREFMEETGHGLRIISSVEADRGTVFFGKVGSRIADFRRDEIEAVDLVDSFPDDLNYPEIEYRAYLRTAPNEIKPDWA